MDEERSGGAKGRAGGWGAAPYYGNPPAARERRWWPWLVLAIVVACIAVFVVEMYVNDCPAKPNPFGRCIARFLHRLSFQPWHQNPLLGPSADTLDKMGALEWYKVVHQHQGWRLVTCIWLHAGLFHLLANMISLLFIGVRLEQQFGFVRIGILYVLSGFGGSVLSALLLRNRTSVGASGALFGLLGAMLSELITNWTIYSNRAAAVLTILVLIVINLGIGIFPYVDIFTHIGGCLTGFLLGFVLLVRPQFGWLERHDLPSTQVTSKYKTYQYVLWVIALVLLIAGFAVGLVMLFKGERNYHCHWCHYLNCIPTSGWSCDT